MDYRSELLFTEQLLSNFRLKIRYIDRTSPVESPSDIGLGKILNYQVDHDRLLAYLEQYCRPNTIYRIQNPLLCCYLIFRLPDTVPATYAYVGPYTQEVVSKKDVLKLADKYHLGPGNLKQLEQFFHDLPLLPSETMLFTIIYTLGERMWGSLDNFSFQKNIHFFIGEAQPVTPAPDITTPEEALLSMQILENRYETESQLFQAVSNGRLHKAELYFSNLATRQYEERATTRLRTIKNYALAMNTGLRIAAGNGSVHPLHIHNMSSQYARRIEALASESECMALMKEMVRKYCLLVKNHSLKGYSLLVRKVLTRIDFDLTADLSLKAQAGLLNVNPSYLSTLFKKETGVTLTEYVNRKRIEQALLLLNSTSMQIQLIAQYCGIPDVNYFTKTFKKIVGKTPKEYRKLISSDV